MHVVPYAKLRRRATRAAPCCQSDGEASHCYWNLSSPAAVVSRRTGAGFQGRTCPPRTDLFLFLFNAPRAIAMALGRIEPSLVTALPRQHQSTPSPKGTRFPSSKRRREHMTNSLSKMADKQQCAHDAMRFPCHGRDADAIVASLANYRQLHTVKNNVLRGGAFSGNSFLAQPIKSSKSLLRGASPAICSGPPAAGTGQVPSYSLQQA